MPLRRKLQTVLRLRPAELALILEAVFMLAIARAMVLAVPFRALAPWLARAPETATCDPALVLGVGRAVAIAARNVPWNAVCLPQAMAAKAMLARRGCGSSFHLGANYDGHETLTAHAWLVAGGIVVVGKAGIADMTPLARFG